jgi:KDO2-lipid IV(A) lauroyltransferase
LLRELRHRITAGGRDLAVAVAPRLSERAADRMGALIAGLGPHLPVLARQVARNMRSTGVYSPAAHRDYFAGLGEHFAGALQVLRCAARDSMSPSPDFLRMTHERIRVDDSIGLLRDSLRSGRGAIVMSPHINNYFMNVAGLNEQVPLTAYMRWVKDEKRQAAKAKWYQASGADYISEPPEAGGPLGRMKTMANVLNAGRALVVLVDLTQKREDGVAVRFFGREVYLPGGTAVLAIRTATPVFMMTASRADGRQVIRLNGPYLPHQMSGDRREAVGTIMQAFADHLERMLTEKPGLWYLWGDKRWTRTFGGDPRYVRPLRPVGASASIEAEPEGA